MANLDALEKIAKANDSQARLIERRMKEGYTPQKFGLPVARSFRRTACDIRKALRSDISEGNVDARLENNEP